MFRNLHHFPKIYVAKAQKFKQHYDASTVDVSKRLITAPMLFFHINNLEI